MKFREHRGQLRDSMATCVKVPDRQALIDHLYRSFQMPLPFDEIRIEPYSKHPDRRIGWPETYVVTLEGYGVIGFTDGPVPGERTRALDELVRLSEEMGEYDMSHQPVSLRAGCPDCGSSDFHPGPRGGAAINIKCANPTCGAKFWYCIPFQSHRIDNSDEFYDLTQRNRLSDFTHRMITGDIDDAKI